VDEFKETPLLKSLLDFQKDAYNEDFQKFTTLPFKMANNVRAHPEFCKSRVKHSDQHVHRIVDCILSVFCTAC